MAFAVDVHEGAGGLEDYAALDPSLQVEGDAGAPYPGIVREDFHDVVHAHATLEVQLGVLEGDHALAAGVLVSKDSGGLVEPGHDDATEEVAPHSQVFGHAEVGGNANGIGVHRGCFLALN